VPVPGGRAYRLDSPPEYALVQPAVARELRHVLERFARESGFSERRPIGLFFMPGIFGHHKVGRAADIYGVGGVGIDRWKRRWDRTVARARHVADPAARHRTLERERRRNLGWRLYKTLQLCGRWSQPAGFPVQLFGPWTRSEGPWTYISDFLLRAHRDHIHVAR
jgi:hypothetical protein